MAFVNEAVWDRMIRIIIGAIVLYLGWGGVVTGTLGTILKIIGFVPLLTGLFGFCPTYSIFKFKTFKDKAEPVSESVASEPEAMEASPAPEPEPAPEPVA